MLSITAINNKGHYELKLIGEVDVYITDDLKACVDKNMSQGGKDIIFDFEDLEYIDSTGLGALIGIREKYKGIDIKVVNLRPNVRRIFDITGLTKFFSV